MVKVQNYYCKPSRLSWHWRSSVTAITTATVISTRYNSTLVNYKSITVSQVDFLDVRLLLDLSQGAVDTGVLLQGPLQLVSVHVEGLHFWQFSLPKRSKSAKKQKNVCWGVFFLLRWEMSSKCKFKIFEVVLYTTHKLPDESFNIWPSHLTTSKFFNVRLG